VIDPTYRTEPVVSDIPVMTARGHACDHISTCKAAVRVFGNRSFKHFKGSPRSTRCLNYVIGQCAGLKECRQSGSQGESDTDVFGSRLTTPTVQAHPQDQGITPRRLRIPNTSPLRPVASAVHRRTSLAYRPWTHQLGHAKAPDLERTDISPSRTRTSPQSAALDSRESR
jgi:hypothetical protein